MNGQNRLRGLTCADEQEPSKTRSPAVAGMADSWPHINLIDLNFRDLEITP